jgi:hypothetical protein
LYDTGLPYASVAGATAYAWTQIDVAKTFTPTVPDAQNIVITGDDHVRGQMVLGPNEAVSAELAVGKANFTVDEIIGGGPLAVTLGDQKFMLRETEKRGCEAQVGLLAYQQAIDNVVGSATRGKTLWRAIWMPKTRIVAKPGAMEEGNALQTSYMVYPSVVSAHLWGMIFTVGVEGATEAQFVEHFFNGPPMLNAWLINSTPTLTLTLSDTAKADEAGTGFDIRIYRWNHTTGAVTDITAASTPGASSIVVVGPVEDDMVTAVYSQAACV